MPRIDQTLHGYHEGHRLLASSCSSEERELTLLERLSDLSGYLPRGTSFERYHTGFPSGRSYAFASTWPDVAATRAGTVLTHTLLIPREHARELDDIWALAPLHRRPASALDRAGFGEPLVVDALPPPVEELRLSGAERQAVVVLLLGTKPDDRPLLWVDERSPEDAVRFLWTLLDPEQRERFAFCTFALQPRSVEGRAFDFLGLPPAARGSLLDRASSEAWWDSGRFLSPRLASLSEQPWVREISQQGAPALERLRAWCRSNELDFPRYEVAILWRFLELEPAAAERLPAARSWADLLERLWPDINPHNPCADRALRQLLARLPEAPFEKRPLFELTDFFQRPLTRRRLATDEAFASEVEALSAHELGTRFARAPEPTLQELPGLVESFGRHWTDKSLAVFENLVASTTDAAVRLSPPLLLTAARTDHFRMVKAALRPLTPGDRLRALDESLRRLQAPAPFSSSSAPSGPVRSPDDVERNLLKSMADAAEHLLDAALVFEACLRRDEALEAVTRVARMLVQSDRRPFDEALAPFLSRVDADTQLAWALCESESVLAEVATATGARAARELKLSLEALVQRCDSAPLPNGPRTLLAFAAELERWDSLVPLLRASPRLATHLLEYVLREPRSSRMDKLIRVAFVVAPPEMLVTPGLFRVLFEVALREPSRLREAMEHVGPQWASALSEGTLPQEELVRWLSLAALREWLRYVPVATLLSATSPANQSQCLPRLAAVLLMWLRTEPGAYDKGWMPTLLERLLRQATPDILDQASEPLSVMIRLLGSSSEEGTHLSDQALTAVARTPSREGWRLVETVFPRVYARVAKQGLSLLALFATLFTGKEKDPAKPLRAWLIDTYASRAWPSASFLRCLDGDTTLFFLLVGHARHTSSGIHFLRQLPFALDADPTLTPLWRRPIEEALSDLRG